MGKHTSIKRLSTTSQSASKSIDLKARKRIEELYELTDEIINAYNEINEKYVHQIYRKYKQLKEINQKLKEKLNHHHCNGCKCTIETNEDEEEESDNSIDDEQMKNPALPSSTTSSIITRTKKKNPFVISDIEDTQNSDPNDSRFNHNMSDNDDDEGNKVSPDVKPKTRKSTIKTNNETEEESEDEVNGNNDEDNDMARLPLALQHVIRNKATKNKNAKAYLLEVTGYPALCEFLRDKSRTSFDHRPSETQVRQLIAQHIGPQLANDRKTRVRVRDELREIHRSYMRTFMNDPHASGPKPSVQKTKLSVKKSPM